MRPDESVYLRHIVDAADRALGYVSGLNEPAFGGNPLVQDGVIRQLEIIGEAARHISANFRRAHATVRWDDMAGMRDKLIHDYFGVDLGRVWLTVSEDLPVLRDQVRAILTELALGQAPNSKQE